MIYSIGKKSNQRKERNRGGKERDTKRRRERTGRSNEHEWELGREEGAQKKEE